jgi:S1-C subfamily serine protease
MLTANIFAVSFPYQTAFFPLIFFAMEAVMVKEKLAKIGKSGLVSLVILFTIATQGGCESRAKTEMVGFPQSFADLAEKVKPAVVNISTTSTMKVPGNPFRHFFGPNQEGKMSRSMISSNASSMMFLTRR